jgi:hypothetical protein
VVVGGGLTWWLTTSRRDKLRDIEHVYVDDEAGT